MKSIFTKILILLMFIAGSIGTINAQQKYSDRVNEIFHKTDNSIEAYLNLADKGEWVPEITKTYVWIEPTESWMPTGYTHTMYYSDGNIHIQYSLDPITLDSLNKNVFTYNNDGQVTEQLIYTYMTGEWVPASRYTHEYNDMGDQTLYLFQSWAEDSWMTISGTRTTYTYENDLIIEEINEDYAIFKAWVYSDKSNYTYDDLGRFTSIISSDWEIDEWVFTEKIADVVYEGDNQWMLKSYITYLYDYEIPDWVPESFIQYTYLEYQGIQVVTQVLENDIWVNSERMTTINDSHYNMMEIILETWIENNWIQTGGLKYLNTYVDDLLVEVITMMWSQDREYINLQKTEYEDYILLDINENQISSFDIKVFPNPANDHLNINLSPKPTEKIKISIYSTLGNLVHTESIDTQQSKINISHLNSGLFFFRIENNDETIECRKFIKQ